MNDLDPYTELELAEMRSYVKHVKKRNRNTKPKQGGS